MGNCFSFQIVASYPGGIENKHRRINIPYLTFAKILTNCQNGSILHRAG